jgi:hypothetical protein
LLGGRGGVKSVSTVEVTVNSKEENYFVQITSKNSASGECWPVDDRRRTVESTDLWRLKNIFTTGETCVSCRDQPMASEPSWAMAYRKVFMRMLIS